jgi:hypothetical protein
MEAACATATADAIAFSNLRFHIVKLHLKVEIQKRLR